MVEARRKETALTLTPVSLLAEFWCFFLLA